MTALTLQHGGGGTSLTAGLALGNVGCPFWEGGLGELSRFLLVFFSTIYMMS